MDYITGRDKEEHGTEYPELTECSIEREDSVHSGNSVYSVHSVRDAVTRTLPENERDVFGTNGVLFRFARELKGIVPEASLPELSPVFEQWFEAARKRVPSLERSDTWFEFIGKWDSVLFPAGSNPMARILELAKSAEPSDCAKQYDGKVRLLVTICEHLQKTAGDRPFHLACRLAGSMLDVSRHKAATWLKGLVHEGVLEITKETDGYRARRYRYRGDIPTQDTSVAKGRCTHPPEHVRLEQTDGGDTLMTCGRCDAIVEPRDEKMDTTVLAR